MKAQKQTYFKNRKNKTL